MYEGAAKHECTATRPAAERQIIEMTAGVSIPRPGVGQKKRGDHERRQAGNKKPLLPLKLLPDTVSAKRSETGAIHMEIGQGNQSAQQAQIEAPGRC
jgi:hypothetical protein